MKSSSPLTARITAYCLTLAIAGITQGCGGGASDTPDLVPVKGTVTLDGKPIEGAAIMFELQGETDTKISTTSSAVTDASGKYELMYGRNMGARPGKHKVTITKEESVGGDAEGSGATETKQVIPEKYNEKSELTADVSSDKSEHNFDLKSN